MARSDRDTEGALALVGAARTLNERAAPARLRRDARRNSPLARSPHAADRRGCRGTEAILTTARSAGSAPLDPQAAGCSGEGLPGQRMGPVVGRRSGDGPCVRPTARVPALALPGFGAMRSWAVHEAAPVRPHRHAGAPPSPPGGHLKAGHRPAGGFAVTADLPILKNTTADALLDGNRTVASGEVLLSPAATRSLITRAYNRSPLPLCGSSAGTLGPSGPSGPSGRWPASQGHVGHLLEVVAGGAAGGLDGDAVCHGHEVAGE